MKFLFSIVIIAVAVLLISVVTLAVPISLFLYQTDISMHFNGWKDDPYDEHTHSCSQMSTEVEEYVETHLGFDCYFVYGEKDSGTENWTVHMWNIVMIDGAPYEFESTILEFRKMSEEYTVQTMQEGFYVDGVKYEKSQTLDNWRELI